MTSSLVLNANQDKKQVIMASNVGFFSTTEGISLTAYISLETVFNSRSDNPDKSG